MSTTKGTQHLAGEVRSASDLDFYIDGVSLKNDFISPAVVTKIKLNVVHCLLIQEMLHIADTKMARRYGDFSIRQIHKLEEVCFACMTI